MSLRLDNKKYTIHDVYVIYAQGKLIKDRRTRKQFIAVVESYLQHVRDLIIEEGRFVMLPSGMGCIGIKGFIEELTLNEQTGKVESKTALVDWKATKELWAIDPAAKLNKTRVFFENDHSDGIRYTVRFHRGTIAVPYKKLYAFKTTRTFKRKMATKIKEGMKYELST